MTLTMEIFGGSDKLDAALIEKKKLEDAVLIEKKGRRKIHTIP